eukprot:3390195-Prymnesium_polylepis.1
MMGAVCVMTALQWIPTAHGAAAARLALIRAERPITQVAQQAARCGDMSAILEPFAPTTVCPHHCPRAIPY